MNYRHIYHAGNFADVLKHIVLVMCLEYLQRKEGGLRLLDAHGGAGLYAPFRGSGEDRRVGRVRRLEDRQDAPGGSAARSDPSRLTLTAELSRSPLIMARSLRAQDRLIAAELTSQPSRPCKRRSTRTGAPAPCTWTPMNACARNIPPKERRGLVLIDPPFELKDEFQPRAADAGVEEALEHGVFVVWYPIKAHLPVAELKEAAKALGLRRGLG